MPNPKNNPMPDFKQQLLAVILLGQALSTSALSLQTTLNPNIGSTLSAAQLTLTGVGTARFFQAFFYDSQCTTLLGVGSLIDNTTGFSFTDQQTIRINSHSIYKLATNLGISPAAIGCLKIYINGSAQSSQGVACTTFTDETCSSGSGTCVSSQTNAVSWVNNPSNCGTNPNIYLANNGSNKFSVCNLSFTSCTNSDSQNTPRGLAVNNGHAYSTNGTRSPVGVYVAVLNQNGALGTFSSAVSGYTNLSGIALNSHYVYFNDSNGTSGTGVNQCNVNAVTGSLSNCGDSGATGYGAPAFLAFNNGYAYIANGTTGAAPNTLTKCSINATTGKLGNCTDAGPGAIFSGPRGVAIYNGLAYIANWQQGNGTEITICSVSSSTGALSNCARNSPTCGSGAEACFSAPYGIAL